MAGVAEVTGGTVSTGGGGAGEGSCEVVAEVPTSSKMVVEARASGVGDQPDNWVGWVGSESISCSPTAEDIGDKLATTFLNSSTSRVSESICSH